MGNAIGQSGVTDAEIRDYLAHPEREREGMLYAAARRAEENSRVAASHALNLHSAFGTIVTALAENAAATRDHTATLRVFGGLPASPKGPRRPAAPASVSVRPPMPSLLEMDQEDDTKVTRVKQVASQRDAKLQALLDQADAELVVQASDANRLRKLSIALGIIIAIAAVAGIIWAIFKFGVGVAHA